MAQKGKPLTEDDTYALDLAKEDKKNNINIANSILDKIVTISSTTVGGGVVFLNSSILPGTLITPILVLFLLCLIISFKGIVPYASNIDTNSPTDIEAFNKKALNHKLLHLKISASLYLSGLMLAILGIGYKYLC